MQLSTTSNIDFEQLVDHIAEHGFCVIDHFLPEDVVTDLANEARQLKQAAIMQEAGIGREHLAVNKTIRSDSIYWLNQENASEAQKSYFDQMEQLKRNLNQQLYAGLFGLESHLAVYPVGAFYKRHLDCFTTADLNKPQRKISCIVYLNQHWQPEDGGQLRLYLHENDRLNNEKYMDILPVAGRAVIFLSDRFYHEVLPANRERLSLTGWLFNRPLSAGS
jgi:SM-20-related protein